MVGCVLIAQLVLLFLNRWHFLRKQAGKGPKSAVFKKKILFVDEITPSKVTIPVRSELCAKPVRAGSSGEGGWWVCPANFKMNPCVVYSYGIRDDFAFDKFMSAVFSCKVHGFDPSLGSLKKSKAHYETTSTLAFHDTGVGMEDKVYLPGEFPFLWPGINYLEKSNSEPWKIEKITTTMRHNRNNALSVLKIDVEGAEWYLIEDLMTLSWDELAIELHFPPRQYRLRGNYTTSLVVEQLELKPYQKKFKQAHQWIDRVAWLERLLTIADLWRWSFNPDDHHCVELYLHRRNTRAGYWFG